MTNHMLLHSLITSRVAPTRILKAIQGNSSSIPVLSELLRENSDNLSKEIKHEAERFSISLTNIPKNEPELERIYIKFAQNALISLLTYNEKYWKMSLFSFLSEINSSSHRIGGKYAISELLEE